MAKRDKKSPSNEDSKRPVKDSFKDAVKFSVEPPPRAITPPEKKPGKKK